MPEATDYEGIDLFSAFLGTITDRMFVDECSPESTWLLTSYVEVLGLTRRKNTSSLWNETDLMKLKDTIANFKVIGTSAYENF